MKLQRLGDEKEIKLTTSLLSAPQVVAFYDRHAINHPYLFIVCSQYSPKIICDTTAKSCELQVN
jgi:hypothetical protein